MRSKLEFLRQSLIGGCVHHPDRPCFAASISDVNLFFSGIVAEVVYVVSELNRTDQVERARVIDVQLAFIAADEQLVHVCAIHHALWPGNSANAARTHARRQVHNLFGVVPQCRNEKSALGIDAHVIDPALHIGQRDRPCQHQRRCLFGNCSFLAVQICATPHRGE